MISRTFTFLTFLVPLPLAATITIGDLTNDGEHLVYRNPVTNPDAIFAVDLDGDNDRDILALGTANQVDTIIWLENTDGNGTWGPPQTIDHTHETRAIYPADIDGDTDLDVVACSIGFDDKIFWFENTDGAGTFSERKIIATAEQSTTVFAIDLDRDNDVDVVWGNPIANAIKWAENTDGAGTFGAKQTIVSGNDFRDPEMVRAGDLDGDGDNDVVVSIEWLSTAQPEDRVLWIENTTDPLAPGVGSFAATESAVGQLNAASSIALADIDGVNGLDVVAASEFGFPSGEAGGIVWFANNGSGTFAAAQDVVPNLEIATSVTVANLDGDTDLDVLYTNGDSLADVLTCSLTDNTIARMAGTGSGFSPLESLTTSAPEVSQVTIADLDGLNGNDLIAALTGDANPPDDDDFLLFLNNGSGAFPSSSILDAGPPSDAPWSSSVAELDGNPGLDVILAWSGTDEVKVMMNNGNGTFAAPTTIGTSDGCRSVAAANLDGLAGNEVVAAGWVDGDVFVYKNNGSGSFAAGVKVADLSSGAEGVELVDIDGDTDLDIFFLKTSGTGGPVHWIENDGVNTGTFTILHTLASPGSATREATAVDLDNDGDPDCVTVQGDTNGSIKIYENDGAGSFSLVQTLNSGEKTAYRSSFVDAHDVDADGDEDILVGSSGQTSIYWYENLKINDLPDPLVLYAESFGLSGDDTLPLANTDGDLATLIEEYAFNLNPTIPDSILLPPGGGVSGGMPNIWFEFRPALFPLGAMNVWAHVEYVRRITPDNGLTYLAQSTADLVTWDPLTGTLSTVPINTDYEWVEFERNLGNRDNFRMLFGRLETTYTAPTP